MGMLSGYSEPPDIYGEEPPQDERGEEMHTDDVKRLLQDIDGVECDMRRLESRLTSIRERLFKASGCAFGINGHPKRDETVATVVGDCPF